MSAASENPRCEYCKREITHRGKRGPAPRHCSASCRARKCDRRAKKDGRFKQWTKTSALRRRAND